VVNGQQHSTSQGPEYSLNFLLFHFFVLTNHLVHAKYDRTVECWYTYSSTTNNMQRYTMVFITINALHVSGGSSTHHHELKTVYTASCICRAFTASYRYHGWVGTQPNHDSGKKQKKLDKYRCCVYLIAIVVGLGPNSTMIAVRSRKSSTNTDAVYTVLSS
jgi:hypothetical protein